MFVVTVFFRVDDVYRDQFHEAMLLQARNSRDLEPDCHVFDVCVDAEDPCRIYLYEKYTSKAAFDAHLASDHFVSFDKQVAPWVLEKKVQVWIELGAAG